MFASRTSAGRPAGPTEPFLAEETQMSSSPSPGVPPARTIDAPSGAAHLKRPDDGQIVVLTKPNAEVRGTRYVQPTTLILSSAFGHQVVADGKADYYWQPGAWKNPKNEHRVITDMGAGDLTVTSDAESFTLKRYAVWSNKGRGKAEVIEMRDNLAQLQEEHGVPPDRVFPIPSRTLAPGRVNGAADRSHREPTRFQRRIEACEHRWVLPVPTKSLYRGDMPNFGMALAPHQAKLASVALNGFSWVRIDNDPFHPGDNSRSCFVFYLEDPRDFAAVKTAYPQGQPFPDADPAPRP